MLIEMSKIRRDGPTQFRERLDDSAIAEYAERDREDGSTVPPAGIVEDEQGNLWMWDGFHRYEALESNGRTHIPAIVTKGTLRDAQLLAMGANADHGVRLTNRDKANVVRCILKDEEWRKLPDREIARKCNVSHPTVAKFRAELYPVENLPPAQVSRPESGTTHKPQPQHRIINPTATLEREPGDDDDESDFSGEETVADAKPQWPGFERMDAAYGVLSRSNDEHLRLYGKRILHAKMLNKLRELHELLEEMRRVP